MKPITQTRFDIRMTSDNFPVMDRLRSVSMAKHHAKAAATAAGRGSVKVVRVDTTGNVIKERLVAVY